MKKLFPLLLFVIGLVLVYFGLEASDSIGSTMSEIVNDAPSNKSIALLVLGALAAVGGFVGFARNGA